MMKTMKLQRGAVLVVSLALLIVMTLLGLSAMNNTIMEERMAGNLRNYNLAFQSAEAALRGGETAVGSYTSRPVAGNTAPNGVYTLSGPDPDRSNAKNWWEEVSETWWAGNAATYSNDLKFKTDGNLTAPQYVIEERSVVQDSMVVGQQQDFGGRQYYQITSRGKGSAKRSSVMLRSTFARRF